MRRIRAPPACVDQELAKEPTGDELAFACASDREGTRAMQKISPIMATMARGDWQKRSSSTTLLERRGAAGNGDLGAERLLCRIVIECRRPSDAPAYESVCL